MDPIADVSSVAKHMPYQRLVLVQIGFVISCRLFDIHVRLAGFQLVGAFRRLGERIRKNGLVRSRICIDRMLEIAPNRSHRGGRRSRSRTYHIV